jgi:hypothetical protein
VDAGKLIAQRDATRGFDRFLLNVHQINGWARWSGFLWKRPLKFDNKKVFSEVIPEEADINDDLPST